MADLEAIVKGEMDKASAGTSDETVDTGSDDSSGDVDTDASIETDTGNDDAVVTDDTTTDVSEDDTQIADKVVDKAEEVVADPDDPFAKEHDLAPKDKTGRVNRIPYPRVKKITENAERKLFKSLTGADLGTGETIAAAIERHQGSRRGETEELSALRQGDWVLVNKPEKFLEILPQINPKYAELLASRTAMAETKVEDAPSDMPEPDYDLGDGRRTYTPDGIKKLAAWIKADAVREARAQNDKDLKPIRDEREVTLRIQQAASSFQQTVERAKADWPGFNENKKEIEDALRADTAGKLTLWTAYLRVKNGKDQAALEAARTDETKLRAKILKEMNEKPSATSTTARTTATKRDPNEAMTTEDIIRNEMRKAGLK